MRLALRFERAVAPEAGRERLRTRDRGDAAMPARHQMREDAADAVFLVVHNRGDARIVTGANHGDDRQPSG